MHLHFTSRWGFSLPGREEIVSHINDGVRTMRAQCPECESWIQVPRSVELWDTLACPNCQTELQLISDSPYELDYADLDDYDDDDYDLDDDYDDDDEDY
jgi:hypothetical protein